MKYTNSFSLIILTLLLSITTTSCGQSGKSIANGWPNPINITSAMDTAGVKELSGLHWNPVQNRLFTITDDGDLYILQMDVKKQTFKKIGCISKLGGPEGVTQVDYIANEFYTIDEKSSEIRRFTYLSDFSKVKLAHKWDLRAEPASMADTGNDGPEGIVFIPDSYLQSAGFTSSETGDVYTSKKGMGGLLFIAHQKKGYIWVFDVNPDKDNDYAFVGKYKTSKNESCDLAFDRSTGLLYILHNTDGNWLEVTDLSTNQQPGKGRFITKVEYQIPNPTGNINIEGIAITPKFADPKNASIWLCRDVSDAESLAEQEDCLWQFKPFATEGSCIKDWNKNRATKKSK